MCQDSGRQCTYGIALASGWIRPTESLGGDQRKREENPGRFSSPFRCFGQRLQQLLHLLCDSSFRHAAPASGIPAPAAGPGSQPVAQTVAREHQLLCLLLPLPQGWRHLPAGVNHRLANMPISASHLFHQETYGVPVLSQRNERKVCLGRRTPEALRPASPKPLSPLGGFSGEGRG